MAQTFVGGCITFSSITPQSLLIISGSQSGVATDDIETTHTKTSGDAKTYMPAEYVEGGTYSFDTYFNPDEDILSIVGVSDTVTIDYPAPTGKTTGASHVFTGYISGYEHTMELNDRMVATITVKVASDVTVTAAS